MRDFRNSGSGRFCGLSLVTLGSVLFRTLQLALALAVCGLYGQDLHSASKEHKYMDSKWVYAVVVGGIASVTAIAFMFRPVFAIKSFAAWAWHLMVTLLWLVLFGIFGHMYIGENAQGDAGIQRMKNAAWVDLTNFLLWLIASAAHVVYWVWARKQRTLFTGRATV